MYVGPEASSLQLQQQILYTTASQGCPLYQHLQVLLQVLLPLLEGEGEEEVQKGDPYQLEEDQQEAA